MVIYHEKPELKYFWLPNDATEFADANPKDVLADFYSAYGIDDALKKLWETMKNALDNEAESESMGASSCIHFYERIHDMMVASYIIARKYYRKKKGK